MYPAPYQNRSGQSAAAALLLTGYHPVRCTLYAYLRGTKIDTKSPGRQDSCAKVLYRVTPRLGGCLDILLVSWELRLETTSLPVNIPIPKSPGRSLFRCHLLKVKTSTTLALSRTFCVNLRIAAEVIINDRRIPDGSLRTLLLTASQSL